MSDLHEVEPEFRPIVRRFPSVDLSRGWILAFARVATRFARTVPTEGVAIQAVVDHGVRVRVYRPLGRVSAAHDRVRRAGMLLVHGGGLVAGDPKMDDALIGGVVRELGIVVASVEYRRAPQHRYPVPLDDCARAWHWLHDNADRLGVDRTRIALGGESAGGCLAASLAQRLHDQHLPEPCAQWLMCPMLDDRTVTRPDLDERANLVWNNRNNRFGWRSYLGSPPGGDAVPVGAVPARRTDLRGLPPTWIGIAGLDLFADEDRQYADRLRAAGVPVTVDLVEGVPHGFQSLGADTDIARAYLARARAWLAQAVATIPNLEGPSS